ncbi:Swt1 family HEPN domain-containing protein [Rubinisphaera margarita]|uniref:Swt1 family HEPN domain-containing protein n=1 Tax=Rubinisphaera margarita TaxID=2909586 RepID=UPI001EE7FFD5|nr:Swt1 family HEPN domain-containing protein [Rubinisphaera margarita]MCG6157453.1 hypothetical protein [Rubinisphaera margarita]
MTTVAPNNETADIPHSEEQQGELHWDYVGDALDVLTAGLAPYVESQLKTVFGDQWIRQARASFRRPREQSGSGRQEEFTWDAHSTLTVMWDQWNAVFRQHLGHYERSLVSELREFRNRWAHQRQLNFDDTYRVLDSIERLLSAIGCDTEARMIYERKQELLEREFSDKINERQMQAHNNRNKWWTVGIYIVCCAAIVLQMMLAWSSSGYLIAGFVVLVFIYLIYQRLQYEPVVYGPRECRKCFRIIYTPDCPYCGRTRRGEVSA